MKKYVVPVLLFLCFAVPGAEGAGKWNLKKNVQRLEGVSPDYKKGKDIDAKFLNVLKLTERTKKQNEIYTESKRIASTPALAKSKYMDSFVYYMLVKSLGEQKKGTKEIDFWLDKLKEYDDSHLLFPAYLIRLRRLPENSREARSDIQHVVEWLKTKKPKFKLHAPEYSGNVLFGYKPRSNYAEGNRPTLYFLGDYMRAITPPPGFQEDETYLSLLSRIRKGREDILEEMISLYGTRKSTREKRAELYYERAMLRYQAKDLKESHKLLKTAAFLDKKNVKIKEQRDKVELEMTYQGLSPSEEGPGEGAEPAGRDTGTGIPKHLDSVDGHLTPVDRMITTAELLGRSKGELRVMRNEIYARHGRVFSSPDLQAYFSRKPWYKENPAYSDSLLSEIDKENVKIIQEQARRIP